MTPMQRNFAINYAQTQNAEQSALAAGYSKKYARSHVQRLLKHPDVVAEIKRIRNKVNQMVEKNATDVVNQFSKIAFTDRVSFMKEDPERPGEYMYKAPHELTQDQRDCVETTKMYTTEIVVIEDSKPKSIFRQEYNYVLSDKAKALEQMGRHFGIFDDRIKLGVSQANPFRDATPKQLEQLKSAFVKTMNGSKIVDGQFEEVKNGK